VAAWHERTAEEDTIAPADLMGDCAPSDAVKIAETVHRQPDWGEPSPNRKHARLNTPSNRGLDTFLAESERRSLHSGRGEPFTFTSTATAMAERGDDGRKAISRSISRTCASTTFGAKQMSVLRGIDSEPESCMDMGGDFRITATIT